MFIQKLLISKHFHQTTSDRQTFSSKNFWWANIFIRKLLISKHFHPWGSEKLPRHIEKVKTFAVLKSVKLAQIAFMSGIYVFISSWSCNLLFLPISASFFFLDFFAVILFLPRFLMCLQVSHFELICKTIISLREQTNK